MVAKLRVLQPRVTDLADMSYADEDEGYVRMSGGYDHAYVGKGQAAYTPIMPAHTTKIAPSFDGTKSWFAFEEAIDDWTDVTELEPEKRGPALRNRLEGDAAIYRTLLDRELLKNPDTGVQYFKQTIRPHFVKGAASVFLYRMFALMRANRGSQEMLRWIGRFSVLRKRLHEAWMDLLIPFPRDHQMVAVAIQQAIGGLGEDQVDREEVYAGVLTRQRNDHMARYPFNDHLISLIFTCLGDLTEQQRERLQSTLLLRGLTVENYTYDLVREALIELFCAPRSALDNPHLRTSGTARSFCIIEYGELEGECGFWVEDDLTGHEGFVPETDDVFWVYDEISQAWASHPFQGRKFHKTPGKGKGKGKGAKGKKKFIPYKRQRKGRFRAIQQSSTLGRQ